MFKHLIQRVVAILLVLCMAISPVMAASFSDVQNHWSKTYVEDMAARGIILGYTDGTFRPDKSVTTMELLVMLSRVHNVSTDMIDLVYADYKTYLTGLLGTNYSWAHKDLALCLATNILSKAELETLYQSNSLGLAAVKEDVSVYLIRTMGLSAEVENLSTYTLSFSDVTAITASKRPYVFVLQARGIVAGDTSNKFTPKAEVSRGVVSTMLSRAIEYMEKNNITIPLTNYANYKCISGTVQGVVISGTSLAISLSNVFAGDQTITATTSSKVYLDGVLSAYNSISTGKYIQIRTDAGNNVVAINVFSSPRTILGTVVSVDNGKITVVDAATKVTYKLMLTRDSEVQISSSLGNQSGSSAIINSAYSFETASCIVDSSYRVKALLLSGGASFIDGVVTDVETVGTVTNLLVSDFAGIIQRYPVPTAAAITVNGSVGSLSDSQIGSFVRLKIGNDDQVLKGIAVDTTSKIVQGSLKSVTLQATPQMLYVTNIADATISSATISADVKAYYEGSAITPSQLQTGTYVSAKMQNSKVVEIHTYPSTSQVKGTLSSVTYGTDIVLQLLDEAGKAIEFTLNPSSLPAIERDSVLTTIDKLRGGDAITIFIQYNKISSIETTAGKASTTGIVTKITMEMGGTRVTIKSDNGAESSYILANNAEITRNEAVASLYDIKIGNKVSLVLSNDEIVTLNIESSTTLASDLSGKILFVNKMDSSILLEITESTGITKTITVNALNVSRNSRILNIDGGVLTISDLAINDLILVIGSYNGTGFDAKIIIRR